VATARPQHAHAPERPAEPSHIGAAIRERRKELGISLREIGGRIGVSASLISQIEHDKVTPSVSTLWALVTELQRRVLCADRPLQGLELGPGV